MASPRCPKCNTVLVASREEHEWYCPNESSFRDHLGLTCSGPHYYAFMPRAMYNDLKNMARTFEGDEDAFAATLMDDSYVRDMARRAFRKAKASG